MTDDPSGPPPPPLDYRRPDVRVKRGSLPGQGAVGFAAWIGMVAVVYGVSRVAAAFADDGGIVALFALPGAPVGLFGVGLWLHTRRGWRGFLPGLLLGFGLTCLPPVGIVAVVCGAFR